MKRYSVPSYYIKAILKFVDKNHKKQDLFLKKHHIPTELINNPNAHIPAKQFTAIQQDITHFLNDEMTGYFEKPLPLGTFSILCHSLIHSKTIGSALTRYCQFQQMLDRGLITTFEKTDKLATIRLHESSPSYDYQPYAYESALYYAHRLLNWLGNQHIPLTQVNLKFAQPEHVATYRPLFFGAPVFFQQANNELIFNDNYLRLPVVQNQQTLSRFLQNPLYNMLSQEHASSRWSTKTSKLLQSNLASMPDLENVANTLSLHPQTLRRRLHDEGTSYQQLKNEARRDYAIHMLSSTEKSVEQIALEAGFSEPSTFIRAFKGWTGITPLAYRKTE